MKISMILMNSSVNIRTVYVLCNIKEDHKLGIQVF